MKPPGMGWCLILVSPNLAWWIVVQEAKPRPVELTEFDSSLEEVQLLSGLLGH